MSEKTYQSAVGRRRSGYTEENTEKEAKAVEQNNNKGMTALLILQLVFIILKLLDAVKWSW